MQTTNYLTGKNNNYSSFHFIMNLFCLGINYLLKIVEMWTKLDVFICKRDTLTILYNDLESNLNSICTFRVYYEFIKNRV